MKKTAKKAINPFLSNVRVRLVQIAVVVFIFFLMPLLSSTLTFAQQGNDSSNNYYYLNQKYQEFFEDIISTYGVDSLNGFGYKNYFRWNNYWYSRHGHDGDLQTLMEATSQYFLSPQTSVNPEPWEIIGPVGLPKRPDGTYNSSSYSVGKGMVISLWVNPSDREEIFAGTHTAGLFYTNDGGNSWITNTDQYPEINGIYQVVQHPDDANTFYILSANVLSSSSYGVFKSIDHGQTWSEFPIEVNSNNIYLTTNYREFPKKLIFHPDSSNVMFLLTQSLILKTQDGGNSWDIKYNGEFDSWGMAEPEINDLCGDGIGGPNDYECVLGLKQQEIGFNNIFYNSRNPDTLFVSGHLLLRSIDFGETWQNITEDVKGYIREWNIVTDEHPNYPGYFWLHAQDMANKGTIGDSSFVYKYDIGTGETERLLFDDKNDRTLIRISPTDSSVTYLGGTANKTLHYFDNNSMPKEAVKIFSYNFSDNAFLHVDCRDLSVLQGTNGNDSLFIACDGGVSAGRNVNTSGGHAWAYRDLSTKNPVWKKHLNITEFYAIDGDESEGDFLIGNTQDLSGFYLDGLNWVHAGNGDGGGILIDKSNPLFIYFADYQGRLKRSDDKGKDFDFIDDFPALDANPRIPLALDPDNPNHLYVGERGLRLYSSCRNSSLYDYLSFPHDDGQIITAIEFSNSNSDILYVGTKKAYNYLDIPNNEDPDPTLFTGCIWKSFNKGNSWIDISAGLGGAYQGFVTDICINPLNANEIWVTFSNATSYSDENISKKIYHSIDGGLSYDTFVDGLPDLIPVNKIDYDINNHHLYIVTDIGVFTRDLIYGTGWEDYNDELPLKMVNDVYLNQKDNKIIAATYGRSIWETTLKPTADCPDFSATPIRIRENTLWESLQIVNSDVIIDSGYTLTIKSVSFFNSKSKIIVEPGGKLIIDGGTLTNGCDSTFWQGIEVWGNSAQGQNPLYQGMIEILNGGIIENAITAVLLDNSIPGGGPGGYTGGIIHANDAIFKNNLNDIIINPYGQATVSLITNCEFITDENWQHEGLTPQMHIGLFDYYGLFISGCSFVNEDPTFFPTGDRGIGIMSSGSSYSVDHMCLSAITPCNEFQPTKFEGLYYGIMALGTTSERTISVQNSEFDCYRGIFNSAIHNSTFILNDFVVPPTESGMDGSYGLYIENSTGYQVEGNYFEGDGTGEHVGLYVNNSGEHDNLIYNNTFSDLYCASAYQDINRYEWGETTGGLLVKCNDYTNNSSDISVVIDGPYTGPSHGIAEAQGYIPPPPNQADPTAPAGNTFSDQTGHIWDIYNEGRSVIYTFHNINSTSKKVEPIFNFGNVTTIENKDSYYTKENACPPNFGGGGSIGAMKTMMVLAESSADSTNTQLLELTDGGDTEELAFEVAMAMPGEEIETRDMLLAESPDLSDTVMVAAVEKEEVLPNAMVRDVLAENPQAAKSMKVQDALDNRTDEMPQYMRNQINQGFDTVSQKELLEAKLAFHHLQQSWAYNKLHYLYRTDTTVVNVIDSLEHLYTSNTNLNKQYRLAMLKLTNADTTQPFTIISNIEDDYELTGDQENERQAYNSYFTIIKKMKREGLHLPDSVLLGQLADIESSGYGMPAIFARNMLIAAKEVSYPEPVILPDTGLKAGSVADPSIINIDQTNNKSMLVLKPNPANDYVIVKWRLPVTKEKPVLYIHDMEGKLMENIKLHGHQNEIVLTLENRKPGTYVFSIVSDGVKYESQKLNIIK